MSNKSAIKYRSDYQAPDYTITDVALDFQLDAKKTIVKATSHIKRLSNHPVDLILDGEYLVLRSLKIDGCEYTQYTQNESGLVIHSTPEHPLAEAFVLEIINEINPSENTALEGLYQSGEALCSQCEAEGFRRITFYLDRPDVLAKFTTKITGCRIQYPHLLSNGNKIESGELDGNQHYAIWVDPFPKPSYLFALVAGDFDVLQDRFTTKSNRDIELVIYVDKGNLDKAPYAMSSLKASMKWDETRFGLEYDLDIYMIVAVDFFNMGAMENKGLNVFNSKFVLAKSDTATDVDYQNIEAVIGHEYFHNWTGNRITCRDWFQLSLKEGLTVFRDQEFSSDMGSRSLKRIDDVRLLRTVQFAEDAGPMAHPIRPEKVLEMNNFYTVTVYEKGAEVIRMLHTLLGEEIFQLGMKNYIEAHDGSAATCDDFLAAMQLAANQAECGLDLTQFERWYSQSGTPEIVITDEYDSATGRYILNIKQSIPATPDNSSKLPMMIPLGMDFYSQTGQKLDIKLNGNTAASFNSRTQILLLTEAEQTFEFIGNQTKPIPTFLRAFSAPIKLVYAYTTEQLRLLMRFADNAFIRWDAGQSLLSRVIREAINAINQQKTVRLEEDFIDIYRAILLDEAIDIGLSTQLLILPTVAEVVQWYDKCDPIVIDDALKAIKAQLGLALQDELYALYIKYQQTEYHVNAKDIAQRGFVNLALGYLACSMTEFNVDLAQSSFANTTEEETLDANLLFTLTWIDALVNKHFQAENMTDKIAALNASVSANLPSKDELLSLFESQYHEDSLVMDKWLSIQAQTSTGNALAHIRLLMEHAAFSMQNPNRVRALIGSFINHNHRVFHAKDGSGYAFLELILKELNVSNPQVASRLIEPLIRFKQYDEPYANLMKSVLIRLSQLENLSNDLLEKITKALG